MPTTILLIRHGQTDWNAAHRLMGTTDVALNEVGEAQAARLAARITEWPVTALYSSPLHRARRTAEVLGGSLGLEVRLDDDWREMDFGELEGLTPGEIRERYAELIVEPHRRPPDPPGGETRAEVARRTAKAFAQLLIAHPGETVAVVSHGSALRQLVTKLFDVSVHDAGDISPRSHSGVTVIEVSGEGKTIVVADDTRHLESA